MTYTYLDKWGTFSGIQFEQCCDWQSPAKLESNEPRLNTPSFASNPRHNIQARELELHPVLTENDNRSDARRARPRTQCNPHPRMRLCISTGTNLATATDRNDDRPWEWCACEIKTPEQRQMISTEPVQAGAVFPTGGIDQVFVCKLSGCARTVAAENRERIAFLMAKGPHG